MTLLQNACTSGAKAFMEPVACIPSSTRTFPHLWKSVPKLQQKAARVRIGAPSFVRRTNHLIYAAEGREALVDRLESRFLYLGADAKETLRGRRPSYRDILLGVRARLDVHCSEKLSTEDLEVEIFLHLLQHNTREGTHWSSSKHQFTGTAERVNPMGQYSKNWHVAFKLGGGELLKVLIKGGGVFSASLFQRMVARRLGGESSCRNGSLPNSKRSFEEGWSSSSFKLAKTSSNACSKTGSCWSCVILCHFAKHLYALWTTVSSHIIFHLV
ncbi:hypothetical protein KP509_1Z076800 [Ceratopteris richardii]|nr:hypothetical protein KP509_1Z076800 [Ceratopteris richardii]